MKYLIALFSLFAASLVCAEDWYEIEVLIFEHQSSNFRSQNDPERWPANIDLSWPSPLIELETSGSASSNQPYVELPAQTQRLDNANYAMRVGDGYRLLWHQVWKAPLLPEEDSPWILIQAGDQVSEHYRLEGAIRIHLARFLHIHSDLWLTELLPSSSREQTDFHWSQLPRPPVTDAPCIFIQRFWPRELRSRPPNSNDAPANWYYPFGCAIDRSISIEEPLATTGTSSTPEGESSAIDALSDLSNANSGAQAREPISATFGNWGTNISEGGSGRSGGIETGTGTIDRGFSVSGGVPVKEIIHIQSQRRMRSEELHYIDHPKVGILAIIHPIEKPVTVEKPIEYIPAPLPRNNVNQPADN